MGKRTWLLGNVKKISLVGILTIVYFEEKSLANGSMQMTLIHLNRAIAVK